MSTNLSSIPSVVALATLSSSASPAAVRPAATKANSPQEQKLKKAAAEFESILLASLWKSMKGSFADPNDDASDPAHNTIDDLGVQSMCTAVGKAGGLGLGKLILKHLEPALPHSQDGNAPAPGKAFPGPADI